MAQAAAYRFASTTDLPDDGPPAPATAFDDLRRRLQAAQQRAAIAERARREIDAKGRQAMDGRHSDVVRLEQWIAGLEQRARDYSRVLNEAASLVGEMSDRIARFESRMLAIRDLLAADTCDGAVQTGGRVTEDTVARDLDRLRSPSPSGAADDLRTRLSRILTE